MFTGLFRRPQVMCPHSPWLACPRKPHKARSTAFAHCSQGPTPGRWPERINTPRLTATTERMLIDRISCSEAAISGANRSRPCLHVQRQGPSARQPIVSGDQPVNGYRRPPFTAHWAVDPLRSCDLTRRRLGPVSKLWPRCGHIRDRRACVSRDLYA